MCVTIPWNLILCPCLVSAQTRFSCSRDHVQPTCVISPMTIEFAAAPAPPDPLPGRGELFRLTSAVRLTACVAAACSGRAGAAAAASSEESRSENPLGPLRGAGRLQLHVLCRAASWREWRELRCMQSGERLEWK